MASKPPDSVDAFFGSLDHPHTDALRELCNIITATDPSISGGIKWNVPSFRTSDWFATLNVRTKQGVGVVMHFGAKKRDDLVARASIADPTGLLTWLADDRAVVAFRDLADVHAKRSAYAALLREWITHVA